MNNATVGHMDWDACETCVHGNKEEGGCLIMTETELGDLANFSMSFDDIECRKYEPVQKTVEER